MRTNIPLSSSPPGATVAGDVRRQCAFVFIANLAQLADAYGQPLASSVSREIQRRLCAHFVTSAASDLACIRDDCFLLWVNDAFEAGRSQPALAAESIERLVVRVAQEAVRTHGMEALPQLHAGWIDVPSRALLTAADAEFVLYAAQPAPDFAEGRHEGGRQRYRADMDAAVQVSDALAAGRIEHAWHPVVDAHYPASTFLYRAGGVHVLPGTGQAWPCSAGVFVPCLERLGLVRLFDRAIVRQALDALRSHPSLTLGAKISTQSAVLDHFWAGLLQTLKGDPSLARRLVIEIGGDMALPSLEAARDLCTQLQMCGCRVAVTGFGRGAMGLADLRACRPDIIKLDEVFVRNARGSAFGLESLQDMLRICAHLATHVVVDGIEREDDLRASVRAGARWLHGSYLGRLEMQSRADTTRPWPANDETFSGRDMNLCQQAGG